MNAKVKRILPQVILNAVIIILLVMLLFPLFMLPMGFMTIPALIRPQVGWRPIEHRRTASIDDVQKMP